MQELILREHLNRAQNPGDLNSQILGKIMTAGVFIYVIEDLICPPTLIELLVKYQGAEIEDLRESSPRRIHRKASTGKKEDDGYTKVKLRKEGP